MNSSTAIITNGSEFHFFLKEILPILNIVVFIGIKGRFSEILEDILDVADILAS